MLNLPRYLERIGYAGRLAPDRETLNALHLAHLSAIPFENLEIQMGLPVRLDLESLQTNLVNRRRGGYCFQQNTLFMQALRALGFDVIACEARVRYGAPRSLVRPRTHMVLITTLEGQRLLTDVGFGGAGILHPIAIDGTEEDQFGWQYRVGAEGPGCVLQTGTKGDWDDLYIFIPEERPPIDFEMGNWYTSTYPESPFVNSLTVQRSTTAVRHILRNYTYTTVRPDSSDLRDIDRAELLPLLSDVFGVDLPEGAKFRALDGS